MFDYPLTRREIFVFLGEHCHPKACDQALEELLAEAAIFKIKSFYCLFDNQMLAERRIKGTQQAEKMLVKAGKAASIIARFPFVKAIAVSGSLSKRFATEDADIDFFIITAPGRVWIARTMLHLFKKCTFLLKLEDMFCMNYFIDTEKPCIREKNIYTAIELATLMPMYDDNAWQAFYTANAWTKNLLPNKYLHVSCPKQIPANWLRAGFEKLFSNGPGDAMDTWLMNMTAKSWQKKTARCQKNSKGLVLGMHAGKHFSKPDPVNYQKKLLQRYEKSLAEIFGNYDSLLSSKKSTI